MNDIPDLARAPHRSQCELAIYHLAMGRPMRGQEADRQRGGGGVIIPLVKTRRRLNGKIINYLLKKLALSILSLVCFSHNRDWSVTSDLGLRPRSHCPAS